MSRKLTHTFGAATLLICSTNITPANIGVEEKNEINPPQNSSTISAACDSEGACVIKVNGKTIVSDVSLDM